MRYGRKPSRASLSSNRFGVRVNSGTDLPGQKTFDHFIDLGDLLERVLGQHRPKTPSRRIVA